jgi:hypothetical protein
MALKIVFSKLGTNKEGAVTGKLVLYDGTTAILRADAFSGGHGHNPIDDGLYRLRLDVRGDESSNQANTDGTLKPYYGIQRVGDAVADATGQEWNMQVEWGSIRARLNPTGGAPDHGDYIHGKSGRRTGRTVAYATGPNGSSRTCGSSDRRRLRWTSLSKVAPGSTWNCWSRKTSHHASQLAGRKQWPFTLESTCMHPRLRSR